MLNIPSYQADKVSNSFKNLQLLYSEIHNGDIYDISNEKVSLICSSGPALKKIKQKSDIPNDALIEKMIPSYDGTIIRVYFNHDTWYFSSLKHINAENGSWPIGSNSKTFLQIFEQFCKFEDFDMYLNRSKAYTFLLLSKDIQNVLANPKDELFLISVFDQDTGNICSNPLPIDKPPWAMQIINSSICGLNIPRPQRGFLYYSTEGNIYQIDFNYFQKMEEVIQNKPWQIVFYEMLKLQVTKKQMSISLNEFCSFYKDSVYNFDKQLKLLYKIGDVIQIWNETTKDELKKNYLLLSILNVITAKNINSTVPTHSFCVRQIAFMKYSFLDELFSKKNMEELFIILDNILKLKQQTNEIENATINGNLLDGFVIP